MTPFQTVVIVDWTSGNDTGPTPRKDAIWAAVVRDGIEETPVYLRNRGIAFDWIAEVIDRELAADRRLMVGFDFPFGYPDGFAEAVTGSPDPLHLWDFFAEHVEDTPGHNNRFDLAGRLNARFPGVGPFWFNGTKRDIPDLPRRGTARTDAHGQAERRAVELQAKGSFPVWQMGGAGAVGGQAMTGMAVLSRLRRRFAGDVAVWPFQPLAKRVAFVEVWPSLLAEAVARENDPIKDRAQVRVLARAVSRLSARDLETLFDVHAPREGWIFGVGHEDVLRRAASSRPTLKNDCFALPPGVDWTPVDEALAALSARLQPIVETRQLALSDTQGLVLAKDAKARRSHPPAANSAVDGYGFAHRSLPAGDAVLDLVPGRAAAGAPFPGDVPPGHAVRILTGAILPRGVDTVVLEEDVTRDGDRIRFAAGVKPGANARASGEDTEAGAIALSAGTRLGPAEIGTLASVGVTDVTVWRRLRVGVLSTGDEIVEPGASDDPAKTYDANRPMLLALLERWRMAAVDLGHVGDDRPALRSVLDRAATRVDAILTSGGASAGDEDHVSALLGEAGSRADWRIALKPGRPLALGVWNGVPVFGLPGNPVAALVCTLIFARPALSVLSGGTFETPRGFDVPAAFTKRKKPGRREYLRARLTPDGHVETFASEGSGRISGLAWADGLVELEDGARHIAPGDIVRYIPYSSFDF